MKPIVFSEPWEEVMFSLRDASKIVLHFHTLGRMAELKVDQGADFFHSLDDRLSEEDAQLIYGDSEVVAAKLIEYSNEILKFYTDLGARFVDESDYVDLLKKNCDNEPKALEYDFAKYWCMPGGWLSNKDYKGFIDVAINEGRALPSLPYEILNSLRYNEFLKTRYWMAVSRFVREKAGKCEECGATTNLHVHHLSYEHRGSEHLHLDELKCLCKDCHLKAHQEADNKG